MSNLTSRELLFLEDDSKLFESIAKNCDFASGSSVDPQFKSFVQSLAAEQRQWISATASLINTGRVQ
jgi:hypothetical protein